MTRLTAIGVVGVVLVHIVCLQAQEVPEMPEPQKEHAWLQQLVGEWTSEVEIFMEPGQSPITSTGTETVRSLGGFWIVAENQGEFGGQPFTGIQTLGYDVPTQQYVGTWVDSMSGYLWKYEGKLDKTGKILTLETEGPCPQAPGEISQFKEVIKINNPDHYVFSSSIRGEDGEWTRALTINYRRKK